jgi:hypothetical protein
MRSCLIPLQKLEKTLRDRKHAVRVDKNVPISIHLTTNAQRPAFDKMLISGGNSANPDPFRSSSLEPVVLEPSDAGSEAFQIVLDGINPVLK